MAHREPPARRKLAAPCLTHWLSTFVFLKRAGARERQLERRDTSAAQAAAAASFLGARNRAARARGRAGAHMSVLRW
jgi:hypothetical protein